VDCSAGPANVGRLFDSIIPQLDHLCLTWLRKNDLEHLLGLSTSLQSLSIRYSNIDGRIPEVVNHISRMKVKELDVSWIVKLEGSDDWETDFDLIEKFKRLVEAKDGLKRVELDFRFQYDDDPSQDVCDQALKRWKVMKNDLKLVCAKNGIEVGSHLPFL
jgi:hypothetical protein